MKEKKMTLVVVCDDQKILLGMKKRGFGVGKWNGFGGKVAKNEDVFVAAERELYEEAHVRIKNGKKLIKKGVIDFYFDNDEREFIKVHFFSIDPSAIIGIPQETEEMRPQWFRLDAIPYDHMWVDDVYWLPILLRGDNFTGSFLFANDGEKILEKNLQIVRKI